jgi:hypothetical protein
LKNKIIDIFLSLFIVTVLISYFYIRQPQNNKFNDIINTTIQNIQDEKWDEAKESSGELKDKWKELKYLVMINYAEADISTIEEHLSNLEASTKNKDTLEAMSSTLIIKNLWNNMGKIVPQP